MDKNLIISKLLAHTVLALLFISIYLFADAKEDNENADRYGGFSHKRNASVRIAALSGVIFFCCLFALGLIPLHLWFAILAGISGLSLFYGWWLFDLAYNKINGAENTHVGSGGIDLWFKKLFKGRAYWVMLGTKITGIVCSLLGITYTLSLI